MQYVTADRSMETDHAERTVPTSSVPRYRSRCDSRDHRAHLSDLAHTAGEGWAQLGLGDIEDASKNGDLTNLDLGRI